jgi:hypothetical protein
MNVDRTLHDEINDVERVAMGIKAERDELLALVYRIQGALGTAEEGDNLVAVARDSHNAEMELAALKTAQQYADDLCDRLNA